MITAGRQVPRRVRRRTEKSCIWHIAKFAAMRHGKCSGLLHRVGQKVVKLVVRRPKLVTLEGLESIDPGLMSAPIRERDICFDDAPSALRISATLYVPICFSPSII